MGLPQRQAASRHDDPIVSVEEWYDDEESGPWCVDDGVAIQVLSTREIYGAVQKGALSIDMKVWRDGRACWLPISECYELTVKPRDPTPVSGIRRVLSRTTSISVAPSPAPPRRGARPTLMLGTSFAIGIVIGALMYLPFAW